MTFTSDYILEYVLANPGHQGRNRAWLASIEEQILREDEWVMRPVEVADLDLMPAGNRALRYAKMPTPFPPVVVVPAVGGPVGLVVLDGNARANAARLRGDRCIDAFIPSAISPGLSRCLIRRPRSRR